MNQNQVQLLRDVSAQLLAQAQQDPDSVDMHSLDRCAIPRLERLLHTNFAVPMADSIGRMFQITPEEADYLFAIHHTLEQFAYENPEGLLGAEQFAARLEIVLERYRA